MLSWWVRIASNKSVWLRGKNLIKGITGLTALSVSQLSCAEPLDPMRWFQRMSEAFAEQTYNGVFVYSHGNRMDSLRIVHAKVDGVERERIVRLDGNRFELIRNGDQLICVHSPDWTGDIQHQIPSGPFAKAFVRDLTRVNQYYRFEVQSEMRVVDRDAVSFKVEPKDNYRYGYRVWFDKETGLLLKSLLIDQGEVLERFQFAQLDVGGKVSEEDLELDANGDALVHYPHPTIATPVEGQEAEDSAWRLSWLPPGFEITSQAIRREISEDSAADTLTYSDGMAAFSVFIDPAGEVMKTEMVAQTGATAAVMRQLQTPEGRYSITVVGEIPLETVKRLAAGVERVSEP